MAQPSDSDPLFQMLILRECNLDPGLRRQIRVTETIEWIGKVLSIPAAIALENIAHFVTSGSVRLPAEITRQAIIDATGKSNVLGYAQILLKQLARFRSPEEAYRICWQTALCYGLIGWSDHAYSSLDGSYLFDPRWKKHHHALGLVYGIDRQFDDSFENLNEAYIFEREDDVRGRVGEGLTIAAYLKRNPHIA